MLGLIGRSHGADEVEDGDEECKVWKVGLYIVGVRPCTAVQHSVISGSEDGRHRVFEALQHATTAEWL